MSLWCVWSSMILISLGANLDNGDDSPVVSLRKAVHILSTNPNFELTDTSRIYKSEAWPDASDPVFYNAIIQGKCDLKSLEIMHLLQYIEQCFGRVRTVRNAPRILDLDLIACGDEVIEERDLIVPHPRMHEREFVLYPLRDVAPDFIHPVLELSVDAMIESLPEKQAIEVIEERLLV